MAYGSPSSTVSAATQGPQPALPVRVQLRRTKGWKMPPNTVKVDRTTKWGNPFIVGKSGGAYSAKVTSRRHAWQLYLGVAPQIEQLVLDARAELRGKNLACWCPLPKPYEHDCCHAAVLLKLANGLLSDTPAEGHGMNTSDSGGKNHDPLTKDSDNDR